MPVCLAIVVTCAISAPAHPPDLFSEHHPLDEVVEPSPEGEETSESGNHVTDHLIGPIFPIDSGVAFEAIYYGEHFTNTRGGMSTRNASRYQGLLDVGLSVDFCKAGVPLPGRFFMLAQNTHGRGLTEEFVGDFQVFSNIDSGDNIMQISEYWWETPWCDDRLLLRLGKQEVNVEFNVVDMAGDFIQSSFGISPNLAVPSYPNPSAAAVLLARVNDSLDLKFGVFDGVPDGRNWGFSGTGATFTIGEFEHRWSLADGLFPGAIDFGIAYGSSAEIAPGDTISRVTTYYVDLEQIIFRENVCDDEDEQGLGVFVQAATVNDPAAVDATDGFNAGLVYRGLVPGRDGDVAGVAMARAWLNFGGTNRETAVEFFYKARVAPWMTIQPDLQYIETPSGIHRDSLVAGVRFEIAL